jgi:ATP-dependent RNA helicase DeaD
MLEFLIEVGKIDKKAIGEITIKRKFSFVNVDKNVTQTILNHCTNKKIAGRKVNIEIADAK